MNRRPVDSQEAGIRARAPPGLARAPREAEIRGRETGQGRTSAGSVSGSLALQQERLGLGSASPRRTMRPCASLRSCLVLGALLLRLGQALGAPKALAAPNQAACLLPPEEGPCRALLPRWYYDRYTQACQEFAYGGCEGNANNFGSLESCEKNCWMIRKVPKICRLEADPGPCRGYLKKYFFNLHSMKCEQFIYGGCYGNDNNFQDEESCVDYCLPEKTGPLLCYSPKDEGSCSSSVTRYYYNPKSQSCEEFSYTGCGGNANNFVTRKDCYNVCKKAGSKKQRAYKSRNKLPKTMRELKKKILV